LLPTFCLLHFPSRPAERLKKLGEELKAEGFDGSEYVAEIRRRAATWPE